MSKDGGRVESQGLRSGVVGSGLPGKPGSEQAHRKELSQRGDLAVKNPPAKARDQREAGSIPGSGRSPGGGHRNPL